MTKTIFLSSIFLLAVLYSFGQTDPEVIIPNYSDQYTETIKKLELGQTDIDYRAFRESFIESEQFKIANKQRMVFDSLQKAMYKQMDEKNYRELIKITKKMLSIDYTSMVAHKILRQTYRAIGDTVNSKKYHDIEFGLLKSITKNGNGKTCETAWPVIQIEEEYFVLDMQGARLIKQSINTVGGLCDKMEVKEDGKKKTYYFGTSKVFEGYNKLGLH
jgi:hypothetical protein